LERNGVFVLAALTLGLFAVSFASLAIPAQAAPGDIMDFHSLTGNIGGASPGSPIVAGISPAGAAWMVGASEVDLSGGGQLSVSVQGLVLVSSGTPGSVTTVQAVLACQTGATTWTYVTTSPVALSSTGNAVINQAITLPAPCYAPIVLIEKGGGSTYFATTGYSTAPSGDAVDFYSMVGNIGGASPGSPIVAGISPAGAAWMVAAASVDLSGGGQLSVSVQGLVLVSSGTPGSVTTVQAVLACQTATGFTTVTTGTAPLSSTGNAVINQAITLPAPCYAPIVLIEKGGGTSYFAVTGFSMAGTPRGVPQFPLGLAGVFVLLAPILVLLRKVAQPRPTPAP